MIEIRELEAFIASAESEFFLTPEGDLHRYSTSASKDIVSLEDKLGCSLFIREGEHSGILTDAGEVFLPQAKKLTHQYHEMLRRMEPFQEGQLNSLYIGNLPILKQYRLHTFFRYFDEDYPDCDLHMETADTRSLIQDLDSGYFDAIVIRKLKLPTEQYGSITLASDEVAAVLSTNHRFANRNTIQLKELKNESFYLGNPHSGSYSFCKQLLIANHISTENVHTAETDEIIQVIHNNQGVSLLPMSTKNLSRIQGIKAIPLQPDGNMPIELVWRKDRGENKYLNALISKAQERTKNIPSL